MLISIADFEIVNTLPLNSLKYEFIIRILVFPLDDISVFGDIFFSWLIFFFFGFRHRFQILPGVVGGIRLGPCASAPASSPRSAPAFAPALGPSRTPPTTPRKFETDGEGQKKNISQEKKITKNELLYR